MKDPGSAIFSYSNLATIVTLAGLFWAYVKLVLERGLFPPTEFTINCNTVGKQGECVILEVLLHLKNLSSSTLIAKNIRVDVKYLTSAQKELSLFGDDKSILYGRVEFPEDLGKSKLIKEKAKEKRGCLLMKDDTFVQGGVDQIYTFATAIPASTTYALIWASFEYEFGPGKIVAFILFLSRKLGLLQWSLKHVTAPHTTERVFNIKKSLAE